MTSECVTTERCAENRKAALWRALALAVTIIGGLVSMIGWGVGKAYDAETATVELRVKAEARAAGDKQFQERVLDALAQLRGDVLRLRSVTKPAAAPSIAADSAAL